MSVQTFRVRWYQRPLHEAWVTGKSKRLIEVAHRRWGKDEIALNATRTLALQRPATYWHCLPEYSQARKAIWEAVNPHTGRRRIDEAFPPEIVKRRHNNEMFLELANGSTWQLIGSDRFDTTVGAGPAGIVYSEWALANPSAWGYHRPMVEENGGWAAFITTPRGDNHCKSMFEMAQGLDGWFAERSSIYDTGALTDAQIEEAEAEYAAVYGPDLGRALFDTEYGCSFVGAVVGAYWAGEVARAEREGRVAAVEIDRKHPVHTAWDLGKAVNNPIWCFQVINGQLRVVDFYLPESDDLDDWLDWLAAKGYDGQDYIPDDLLDPVWGTSRTRYDVLKSKGRKVSVVKRVSVADGIQAGRASINEAVFDAERCKNGLDGLKSYRREWDDKLKRFRDQPVKDWAEHIGSAWRYLSLVWRDVKQAIKPAEKPKELEYVVGPNGVVRSNMSVMDAVKAMKRRRENG